MSKLKNILGEGSKLSQQEEAKKKQPKSADEIRRERVQYIREAIRRDSETGPAAAIIGRAAFLNEISEKD